MCQCNPLIRTPFCGRPGCEWPGDHAAQQIDAEARGEVRRVILALQRANLTLDKKTVEHVLVKDPALAEELFRAHDSLAANIGMIERASGF